MAFQPVTAEEAHRLYPTGLLWVRTNGHSEWRPFEKWPGQKYVERDFHHAYNIGDGYCCALLLEE